VARCRRIEGDRLEVGLGLLEVCLSRRAFGIRGRHQRPDGQFRERDRRDARHLRERRRVPQPGQQDDDVRVALRAWPRPGAAAASGDPCVTFAVTISNLRSCAA
jgi:hypothetical protein